MNTIKTSKYLALSLLIAVTINLAPSVTNAAIFDWIMGDKAQSYQSMLVSFAGIGKDSGISLSDKYPDETSQAIQLIQNNAVVSASNPSSGSKTKKTENKIYFVPATAYSSTIDQTDQTPFITAMGTHVRNGVIAANFLPLGTVVKIPELFGNRTFVVEDRMHSRYFYQIDVWFPSRAEAKEFGLKKIKIEVIS